MSIRARLGLASALTVATLTFPAAAQDPAAAPPAAAQDPAAAPHAAAQDPAAAPPEGKPAEPFAFGDFTWLNGSSRQHKKLLDTPYFTGDFLLDVNYTASTNRPIDNTVVGSTALSRNNEVTLAFLGFGGDFHYENTRARLMTQFGVRSTLVPRNDFSTNRGQFDLQTALRYVSEAYGGYHFDVLNGINVDAGIFMSYVGLFSYDNFENWMYLPSFTSDNTPWFFNGIRMQIFTSDKLKIEPWLINGWQSYGKFNEMPGFGAQVLYRPVEWLSFLSNDYVGWDTQDNPGRFRFHSDNSLQIRYYNAPGNKLFHRAAFSFTADVGGEQGDGVTPFGGKHSADPSQCTSASPCQQQFLSAMLYNRLTFFDGHFAWTMGGGFMHNPGRYLVLGPTGNATPSGIGQPVNVPAATDPFPLAAGSTFDAFDYETGFQYMPTEQLTFDLEFNRRQSADPYFAGHGGVTSPDGYTTTASPAGWRPDLVKSDSRVIAALLVRFREIEHALYSHSTRSSVALSQSLLAHRDRRPRGPARQRVRRRPRGRTVQSRFESQRLRRRPHVPNAVDLRGELLLPCGSKHERQPVLQWRWVPGGRRRGGYGHRRGGRCRWRVIAAMDKAPISAPFARVIVAATLALAIAPACRSPAFVPSAAACGPARDAPSPLFLESSDGQPRVVPLREDASQKDRARLAGITLYMAARPGQTTESLSRELECQGERAVPCPQGEQCDIPIGRLRVAVRSAGSRFAVDLVASSPAAAREVLRRARALTGIVDDASP